MIKPSLTTIIISTVVLLILIVATCLAFNSDNTFVQILISTIFILMLLALVFTMPIRVETDNVKIKISYLVGSKTFQLQDYEPIAIAKNDLGYTIRVFASGGFGGYIGSFKSRNIGNFHAIFLNGNNIVLLKNRKNGKQYIIDKPQNLLIQER